MFKKIIILATLIFTMSCSNTTNSKELLSTNDWEVISILNSNEFSKNPWMHFDLAKNKVNGNSGCNNFFGDLNLTDSTISFGTIGATKMMCPDMTSEDALFNALPKVASYKFDNDRLMLFNNKGEKVMSLQTKLKQ